MGDIMPIEVRFWNITDNTIEKVDYSSIESEKRLEDTISDDISIIDENLFVIGRQIRTPYGKIIDILAIDLDGKISIIELKKNKTPREVVAQALDYASWVQNLSYSEISDVFNEQSEARFEEEFEKKLGPVFTMAQYPFFDDS